MTDGMDDKSSVTEEHLMDKNNKPKEDSSEQTNDGLSHESNKTLSFNPGLPPRFEQANDSEGSENSSIPEDLGDLIRLNEYWSYHPRLHTIGLTSTLKQIDMGTLDAQTQVHANGVNARGWTLTIDYAATGEGRHTFYLRSYAASKDEARAQFRKHFFAEVSENDWGFWNLGLQIFRGTYWPEYLAGFSIPPDELQMHWSSDF
jgi:hypothetical protein